LRSDNLDYPVQQFETVEQAEVSEVTVLGAACRTDRIAQEHTKAATTYRRCD